MSELEKKIQERIDTLTKEREQFIQQANQQLVAYAAAIEALQALLKPEEDQDAKQNRMPLASDPSQPATQ